MILNTWEVGNWRTTKLHTSTSFVFSPFLILLRLLVIALFCQIWFPVAGFTMRLEDIVVLIMFVTLFLPALKTGKLRYFTGPLNIPLILWSSVLALGAIVTVLSPFDVITKKNALINGFRLILACGTFFLIDWHPAPAAKKMNAVLPVIVLFSFITTGVSLLQMGYWDGWLPLHLPEILITFKEGANTEQGRELFALYLGDTGSHTWSGALAMQALLVYLLSHYTRSTWKRGGLWFYFGLLVFILIRISVRNSILGLFIAILSITIVRNRVSQKFTLSIIRLLWALAITAFLLYALFIYAPDSYFIERVRQAIPTFQDGQLVVSRGSNVYGRFEYWNTAVKIFMESPLTGGGFYSFQSLSTFYRMDSIIHAHNSYLQTLAELGIFGVFTLALLMGTLIFYLVRTYHKCSSTHLGNLWWEFTMASIVFLLFSMMFSNTFWSPNYVSFRMITLGILSSIVWEQTV